METAQQIGQSMIGDGAACLVIGVIILLVGVKVAISGTLSEDAQRRNYKRDKEG